MTQDTVGGHCCGFCSPSLDGLSSSCLCSSRAFGRSMRMEGNGTTGNLVVCPDFKGFAGETSDRELNLHRGLRKRTKAAMTTASPSRPCHLYCAWLTRLHPFSVQTTRARTSSARGHLIGESRSRAVPTFGTARFEHAMLRHRSGAHAQRAARERHSTHRGGDRALVT